MADENIGAVPPVYDTLAGKVRVLVGDTTAAPLTAPVTGQGQYAWYSDEELEVLGEMNGGNPKRVAIWVLSQVSISMAMLLKKWTSEDLQVDGPAITRGIENTLKRLSAEVDKEEAAGAEESFDLYGCSDDGVYVAYPPEIGIGWWSTY
jgi:hypothetical protein